MEELKYPIGKFVVPEVIDEDNISHWISEIEELPLKLEYEIENLTDEQLNFQYRPGSWTIRQLVHHIADSQINGYFRAKLTVTEDNPIIRPYREDIWAETWDAKNGAVGLSVGILFGICKRFSVFLRSCNTEDFKKKLYPSTSRRVVPSG